VARRHVVCDPAVAVNSQVVFQYSAAALSDHDRHGAPFVVAGKRVCGASGNLAKLLAPFVDHSYKDDVLFVASATRARRAAEALFALCVKKV
jgi:hypothetical protein